MGRGIVFLLLLIPTLLFACGTTAQRFSFYWGAKDLTQKNEFFKRYGCSEPMNYTPRNADPIIARVLIDAIKSGVERKLINKTLKNYNCAYGARNLFEYSNIIQYVTNEKYNEYCRIDTLKNSYIVKVKGGAVLRSGASKNARRIDAIPVGACKNIPGCWLCLFTFVGEILRNAHDKSAWMEKSDEIFAKKNKNSVDDSVGIAMDGSRSCRRHIATYLLDASQASGDVPPGSWPYLVAG